MRAGGERQAHRRTAHEQRRSEQRKQQVLDHVHGEQLVGETIDARHKRDAQCQESAEE